MLLTLLLCLLLVGQTTSLSASLKGVTVNRLKDNSQVDFQRDVWLEGTNKLVIFGTYAADFNAIEYCQRLRYYLPLLKATESIDKVCLVLNAEPEACKLLLDTTGLNEEDLEVFYDPLGSAGKAFGCETGWRPEDESLSPFVKLFGMLWGLGAWATLPSVIGGYTGNPFSPQPWIEDALAVGTKAQRFPTNALEMEESGTVVENKFASLPIVGTWGRRPLELATLRLQNMVGISLNNWNELKPTQEGLDAGVLTQLGGLAVVDKEGAVQYEWRDAGICHVANFETLLQKIQ